VGILELFTLKKKHGIYLHKLSEEFQVIQHVIAKGGLLSILKLNKSLPFALSVNNLLDVPKIPKHVVDHDDLNLIAVQPFHKENRGT